MTILHTSDWHLGQKFLFRDREEEHRLALDWLLEVLQEERVDVLLVAGDIFDIGNPPNYARRLYYDFLTRLHSTPCRHVVITGGNHDSPTMLEAPRDLLLSLQIHVRGAIGAEPADDLIPLRNESGELEAVVAAVPFLRDRDLRSSVAGESGLERIERLRAGLRQYYQEVGQALADRYGEAGVPCIAMGHLYASGAKASGKQDNIYIGDTENIKVGDFPAVFDYVALGHIHRQQAVGGVERVRYCGSLIPLSFSETKDDKEVLLIRFSGQKIQAVEHRLLPVFRRLKTITGTLPEVEERLRQFAARGKQPLTPWLEVLVEGDDLPVRLDQHLRNLTKDMPLELLKIRLQRDRQALIDREADIPDLEDLDVHQVFARRCAAAGLSEAQTEEMVRTFRELVSGYETEDT